MLGVNLWKLWITHLWGGMVDTRKPGEWWMRMWMNVVWGGKVSSGSGSGSGSGTGSGTVTVPHRSVSDPTGRHQLRPPRRATASARMLGMALHVDARTAPGPATRGDLPFRVLAGLWIITGGLVAAVTGPLGLEHGSWSAAFQVLVGGVLQAGMGIAQHALAARRISRRTLLAEILTWNLGCLAVIGGTVLTAPLLVDAGGLLLVATMVLMIRAVGRGAQGTAWALWTYRSVLLLTMVSVPIGLVLAHLRAA